MLTWVHFGDLHASDEDHWQSLEDFSGLVADANRQLSSGVDFAYLTGDVAKHATPEQYRRVRRALDQLSLRWFAIPGDHDFEPGNLDNFYGGLGAAGRGGPDFRLGARQRAWLRDQLDRSGGDAGSPIVFMQAFPGDPAEDADAIGAVLAQHHVACVETGHTHYNELLNDGAVIYAATRWTGQIEDGVARFSLHTVDGSVASWRFKELDRPWPFVLITSPADHRLISDPTQPDQVPVGAFSVRAKVFGDAVVGVSLNLEDGAPITMIEDPTSAGRWKGEAPALVPGRHSIDVEATIADGAADRDSLRVLVADAPASERPRLKVHAGHDLHSIGSWPEHGLLGTQLGPNKNGRKW